MMADADSAGSAEFEGFYPNIDNDKQRVAINSGPIDTSKVVVYHDNVPEDMDRLPIYPENGGTTVPSDISPRSEGIPRDVSARALISSRDDEGETVTKGPYQVYRWRYYVLAVVAILNFSNTFSWLCFAPVATHTDVFYGITGAANYLSIVFLVAAIPVSIFAMYAESRFGLKTAFWAAAFCNGSGAVLRLLSSINAIPSGARFVIAIIGQSIIACAYPFIMYLPTKVAANWFPESQRALANTIGTMTNPLGVLVCNLLSPQIVHNHNEVYILNILAFFPAVVAFMMTLAIRSGYPKTPPSESAAEKSLPFGQGVKRLFRSRNYIVLLLGLGCGIGMFNALYTMMQQLLCPKGYSQLFSGMCGGLMVVAGTFGAFGSGIVVDRTKKFEEVLKIAFAMAAISGTAFAEAALHAEIGWVIAVCCVFFGFFGLACYPTGLEMSAECTYPVAGSTSAGFIILAGQILGTIFIVMMGGLGGPSKDWRDLERETCTSSDDVDAEDKEKLVRDMTVPLLAFAAIGTVVIVLFLILFKPKYRRIRLERAGKAKLMELKPVDSETERKVLA